MNRYAITEIAPVLCVRTVCGIRSALCNVGRPAGALFCNSVASCVPGAIAEPEVAILIDPLTVPPVGSATGSGAEVWPGGAGVAGASVATACTEYGV